MKKKYIYFVLILVLMISIYYLLNSTGIKKYLFNISTSILDKMIIEPKEITNNITLGINKDLEYENNELKALLGLKTEIYNLTISKVLKRDDWYNELIINKGSKDGIKKNDSVINNRILIGRIKEVGNNYSIVELVTSNKDSSKVSVKVNDSYGIISSYSYDEDVLVINNLLKNTDISVLDKVYTSGLGELDDAGIYIGYVLDIDYDELGLSKIIKVKPGYDLNNIRYVGVLSK